MDKVQYLSFLKKNWLKNNKLEIENVFQFLRDSKYTLYIIYQYIFLFQYTIYYLCAIINIK